MDVFFINPPFSKLVYKSRIAAAPIDAPLSLAYLAAVLEKNKISVSILDANALNKHANDATARVFIDTSSLNMIYPFGLDVFQGNLSSIKGKSLDLVFTGKSALRLAPQEPGRPGLNITAEPPLDGCQKTGSPSVSGKTG